MGNLIFNSVSAEDLGLVIQAPPAYTFPSKDLSTTHVPGRNGDLILDNYCYNNVDRTYSIASVFRPGTGFIANSEKIIKWLTTPTGYCRLEDTYDPLVYRMASYSASGSLSNYYDQATSLSITFNCKPQRYLKSGEKQVDYSGSEITIDNPTNETALPLITVSGIPQTTDSDLLLMTVSNVDSGTVYSSITVSKLPDGEAAITLDSEEQLAYYENQNGEKKDRNAYLNFNGTDFPKFAAGMSKISVAKYVQSSVLIEQYNNRIADSQLVCSAKYQPYDAIIESRQEKFSVKKYDNIKLNKEEVYDAKAYLNLCNDKAESYTFKSFNTILSDYGDVAAFIGPDSTVPDWLRIEHADDSDTLECYLSANNPYVEAAGGGFVMDSSNDKRIRWIDTNTAIGTYKTTAVVNINFYPSDKNKQLKAGYGLKDDDKLPDWLTYELVYDNGSPAKVIYKIRADAIGYYYTEKTGLFSKAQWHRKTNGGEPVELGSVNWSTWKKAFASTSGLSQSTTATFTYKWLYEAPQYDDVTEETSDSDGNKVTEVTSKVHFVVTPSDDLATILTISTDSESSGYFRINDADLDEFTKYYGPNTAISELSNYEGTKALTLYFLPTIPDYSSETGYPTKWLQTGLYTSAGSAIDINPEKINFKVAQDAWYRYSYTDSDGNSKYTDWEWITAGSTWVTDFVHDKTYTVYMITKENRLAERFSYTTQDSTGKTVILYDIGFYDKSGNLYSGNVPPAWLRVDISVVGTTQMIRFSTQATGGYFKWDSGLSWTQGKNLRVITDSTGADPAAGNRDIVESESTDDTTVYFIGVLPSYTFSTPVHMELEQAADTGNPTMINVLASSDGYYKLSTESDWTYYSTNSKIGEAKVSESVTVDYLTPSTSSGSDDVKISIIPRWWLL